MEVVQTARSDGFSFHGLGKVAGVEEWVSGGLGVLLGVISVLESCRLRPIRGTKLVGDDTMPLLIGCGLIVLGLLLAATGWSKKRREPTKWPAGATRGTMLRSWLALVGYVVLLPWIGYTLSTLVGGILLFRTIGRFRWWASMIMGAAVAFILHQVFAVWLKIPLPRGHFDLF